MTKKLITVFTPSYNRKKQLYKCYESLRSQTCHNFVWLIVDDGSSDNTSELVEKWQKDTTLFQIIYDYKENGGLHTAYNRGIELANTELFICIDSDDWMPKDAIEKIVNIWNMISDKNYVGIMGLDFYENGTCVGQEFPQNVSEMFLYEKLTKYKTTGDKKMIHRTELLKKVAPMPIFLNEKNFNPSYMMYQLDRYGKLYVTNDCFCVVDYQPDGMSSNIFKQFKNSPNSFIATRQLYLSFPETSLVFKFKHTIHYVSSCMIAKKFIKGLKEAKYPLLAILAIPFSIALTILVLIRGK